MPNGVICGGAVDGSNHAGEIVTCHAMTALPADALSAVAGAAAPSATRPNANRPSNPGRSQRICKGVIPSPLLRGDYRAMSAGAGNRGATGLLPIEPQLSESRLLADDPRPAAGF